MAMLRRSVDLEVGVGGGGGGGTCDVRRHEVGIRVPCKKMKKRRELDALVAKSHKSLSAVYKSGGSFGGGGGFPGPHGPLLKNDSDSGSDLEGFPSVVSPKHQPTCCKTSGGRASGGLWVPAWLFLIVLIGTLVSATLIWLHIGLKQDFTLLRNHLAKVDAEGKRVPDTFREVDQRLAQLYGNQSQIGKQFEQLARRLEQIALEVTTLNGSARQLRGSISEAVSQQLPGYVEQLNASVHDLLSKMTSLSGELATVRMDLTSIEGRSQHRLSEAVSQFDASLSTILEVISGRDRASSLSRDFNRTLETAIRRAQNESDSRLKASLDNRLLEMKRHLTSATLLCTPDDARVRCRSPPATLNTSTTTTTTTTTTTPPTPTTATTTTTTPTATSTSPTTTTTPTTTGTAGTGTGSATTSTKATATTTFTTEGPPHQPPVTTAAAAAAPKAPMIPDAAVTQQPVSAVPAAGPVHANKASTQANAEATNRSEQAN